MSTKATMLLKGGTFIKRNFDYVTYPLSGPKLCALTYTQRMSDFEDKLDIVDQYMP